VDRATDYFISERTALSAALRPVRHLSLQGNLEYDLGFGRLATADATLNWSSRAVSATVGYRRYRPTFQLWQIWAAFNTIPYNAAFGSVWVSPWKGLRLTARGEVYEYEDNSLPSPLVTVETSGWRSRLGASYTYRDLTASVGYSADMGPGAAASGWDAALGYQPSSRWEFNASGGRFIRPLEYRFDESTIRFIGLGGTYRVAQQVQLRVRGDYYHELRDRPDAAAFTFDQTRLSVDLTFYLSSKVKATPLPPGRMPAREP